MTALFQTVLIRLFTIFNPNLRNYICANQYLPQSFTLFGIALAVAQMKTVFQNVLLVVVKMKTVFKNALLVVVTNNI